MQWIYYRKNELNGIFVHFDERKKYYLTKEEKNITEDNEYVLPLEFLNRFNN